MKRSIVDKLKLNKKEPNWLEYFFVIILWCGGLILYSYLDVRSYTIWSTDILDCLVDGNLYNYYQVVHENVHGVPHEYCGYNYLALIPWAVWNIPIWIIQRYLHIEIMDNVALQLWSHMFLVIIFFVMMFFSKKIVEFFSQDKYINKWNNYLIMSFPFSFMGVILAGQTDIIAIALAVMAVYFLLKDKQRFFLLFMAFSIAAKPFFIFAYIAVILLIEKNIIKAFFKVILSGSIIFVFQMIYRNAPMYMESCSAGTGTSIIQKTIASSISANITYQAPIVIIGLVVVYFISYCIKYNSKKKYYVVYMMTVPMLIYFAFANYEFYRMIYLVPFLMILVTINPQIYRLNLILETVISICGTILVIYYKWTASISYFNSKVLKWLHWDDNFERAHINNLHEFFLSKIESWPVIQNITAAVFVTVIGIFCIINIPKISVKIKQPVVKCERWLYWLNTLLLYVLMGTLLLCGLDIIR